MRLRQIKGRYLWLLPAPGIFLVGAFLLYHLNREVTLGIGEVGDAPRLTGFYADEADLTYRYRWTGGRAQVSFEGVGSAPLQSIEIRAQSGQKPGATGPISVTTMPTMTLTANGFSLGSTVLSNRMEVYSFTPGQGVAVSGGDLKLEIESLTFRPPGDARDLGVKVDRVTLRQQSDGLNLPPVSLLFWGSVLASGLFLLASRSLLKVRARASGPMLLTVVGPALLLVALLARPLLVNSYIAPVAALIFVVGLLAATRPNNRWPESIDAVGHIKPARVLMLSTMLLYGAVALWTILQGDWIGHADYAENAVIARNLSQGRGFTVDYVAQFYKDYPGISHPAETWPLLQPLMIAPFFMLFGPETWAAKLPNLFVMLALAWAMFHVGSKLFDTRVGLLAGLFALSHPYFFNAAIYPINDLAFTLLFFVFAWCVWSWFSPYATVGTDPLRLRPVLPAKYALAGGALAGLLVWSKPSGVVLLIGVALWLMWTWHRSYGKSGERIPWTSVGLFTGMAALVLLPLVIRNMLAFGLPFFSTETYDAYILRYWNGDQTLWERIYKVYVGSELPHPRWIVGGKFGYDALFDAIGRNVGWVWQRGVMGAPGDGDYILGLLPVAGAIVGLSAATRRAGNLFGMVGLSLGIYAVFVLGYWHFEGRYFQVAVPWLYLLLAWGLFWLWDRLRQGLGEGLGRRSGLLFLPVAVAALLWPNLATIEEQIKQDIRPTGYVATLNWIAANSSPADVVMTRDPWELNWHSSRRAVMIPFDDLPTIKRITQQYGVTMLQLGGPVDRVDVGRCVGNTSSGGPYPAGSRPALGGLYCGFEQPGYRLVFKNGGGTIYRLERDR